jgi:hypothetical protein
MARWKALALAVVLLAVFFQVGKTLANAIGPLDQVRRVIGQSAVWRGVNFSSGQDFANYVKFLNATIPQQATVVLPPEGIGPAPISRTPYMQFFLAPRQVVNCPTDGEACAENFSAAGAYVLVVRRDQFPASSLLEDKDRLAFYDENLGVLFPPASAGARLESPTPAPGNTSLIQVGLKLVWPGLWLLGLAAGGWLVCSRLAPILSCLSRFAFGFGLGVGFFSIALFLALFAGFALTQALVIGVTLGWGLLAVLIYFLRISNRQVVIWHGTPSRVEQPWRWQSGDFVALILLLGAAGLASALAIGQAYHWSDEVVLWGAKGYGIAALGLSSGVSEWGTRTTSYPLHLPLMIAAARVLFGDGLPESKLIFPIYYFSLLIVQYDFLRQRLATRTGAILAGAAALLYAASPLVFFHATLAYANLPLTFYLAGAAILLATAFSRLEKRATLGLLVMSGIFLALAGWTRPEGLVLSVLVAALAGLWILFSPTCRRKSAALLSLCGPLLAYSGVWLVTSARVYSQPGWSGSAFRSGLERILAGQINLEASHFVLRSVVLGFTSLDTWGILGFILLVLVISFVLFFKRKRSTLFLVAAGLVCLAAVFGLYLLLANDPASNISWWVDTGLSRMLLPGITLLWIGTVAWAIDFFTEICAKNAQIIDETPRRKYV